MYYQDQANQYMKQLYSYVQSQDRKIKQLEKQVLELQLAVSKLKDRSPTNIERIEYKFDQLKIETLEGTLNIGLNPMDTDQVENFEVMQKGMKVGHVQKELEKQAFSLTKEQLDSFLSNDCLHYLESLEDQYQDKLDDQHKFMIIDDIRRQMDSRIQYYLAKNNQIDDENSLQDAVDQTVQKVKTDVENSIIHFLQHMPSNIKGGDPS
ncbi:spore germination protein GerPC [Metabacillus arenae]|uniref:Spore gernimation protein GerPC n=1 Tax=Metabacillus arenae TaxID=2771434 RepID=A0A926NIH3_9BACI|nr:spore germination protein GerPC [Metabacillus arenae]MBD1380618.1 spore gernimation protein GerPC [Metabacillus arenae]